MINNLICLGVESTAHSTSLGIINDKGEILSDVKDMYKTEKGGLIPVEVAKHHNKVFPELLKQIDIKNVDLISISAGPGLAPCLSEGMKFAKDLSKKLKIPLISINHLIAHLSIGEL